MFIRLKKIKGKDYAYLVESKRVRGKIKQKVKKYIGKVIVAKKKNRIKFFEFLKVDIDSYNKNFKKTVEELIMWELYKHDLQDIKVDISKYTIKQGNSNIVIKLNEGYLYSKTIKDLIKFQVVGYDEYIIGREFAECFVKAGIDIPKSLFVKLFDEMIKCQKLS
jgi:hypothetical protein